MALVVKHTFTSAIADEVPTGRVKPSHWNANHVLVGVTVVRTTVPSNTTALTVTHNLGDANTELTGHSATWNTNVTVLARTSNAINLGFSNPSTTGVNSTLISRFEIV